MPVSVPLLLNNPPQGITGGSNKCVPYRVLGPADIPTGIILAFAGPESCVALHIGQSALLTIVLPKLE
jgi:hypothetical protein